MRASAERHSTFYAGAEWSGSRSSPSGNGQMQLRLVISCRCSVHSDFEFDCSCGDYNMGSRDATKYRVRSVAIA
jgi:hypothetical protein